MVGTNTSRSKWPKLQPVLSPEDEAIREDWMTYWHEVLPKNYGRLERINHGYPAARRKEWAGRSIKTLEVGAGLGAHIAHEDLSFQHYTAFELRESMAERIKENYPQVDVVVGDVQERIPTDTESFDRVVAIHVLEHLPNLPAALQEIRRVLKPGGQLAVTLPCEGGFAYEVARRVSSKRLFEKRYHTSYDWCIKSEHVNTFKEIYEELTTYFRVQRTQYWPFRIPSVQTNLVVGVIAIKDR